MKPVKVRMVKYLLQCIQENHLPYLLNEEKEVMDKVYLLARDNALFNKVWKEIEEFANSLVESKCKPQRDVIIKDMENIKKEMEEFEWKEEKSDEDKTQLEELQKKMDEKMDEYQQVSKDANAELDEYKEKVLDEYKHTSCFDLHDKEYNLIDKILGRSVYDWETEWNVIAPAKEE